MAPAKIVPIGVHAYIELFDDDLDGLLIVDGKAVESLTLRELIDTMIGLQEWVGDVAIKGNWYNSAEE